MKFLLVNFSYSNEYSETIRNPTLGAGYILQHLENNGVDTRYYEWSFDNDADKLIEAVREYQPDLIGCSFMSFKYKTTYSVIDRLADLAIPIVCGGAHVNSVGSQVLSEVRADYLITGEGERSTLLLLESLMKDNSCFSGIPGLVYRKDSVLVENMPVILDINSLDYPRYEQLDLKSYRRNEMMLLSSRGCPYFCTYCQQSALLGKKWRGRTPAHIFEEMEYWAAQGITTFIFNDDNLTLDKKRIQQLCVLISQSRYKYSIQTAGVRIDNIDLETLKIMKENRFDYLSFGIESGSDRVLKEIRKGITVSQVHHALGLACDLGFKVKLYFIINNRTETYADVQASFALARQYPIVMARFTNLVPYPHTYDFDWIVKNGRLLYSPEDYLNDPDSYIEKPLYDAQGMTLAEREQVLREAREEAKRYVPGLGGKLKEGWYLLQNGNYRAIGSSLKKKLSAFCLGDK